MREEDIFESWWIQESLKEFEANSQFVDREGSKRWSIMSQPVCTFSVILAKLGKNRNQWLK